MIIRGSIPTLIALCMLAGLCGCVAVPPLEKIQSTQVCENGLCKPLDMAQSAAVIERLKGLFANGLTQEFKPCEAKPGDFTCVGDDLGLFVMGGPIPGRGALKAMTVLSATAGPKPGTAKLRIAASETFLGTPLICAHADATLSVTGDGKVVLDVEPHYCNWALIGNLFTTLSIAIDHIDFSGRRISGFYSIATTGTGNGSGSGYTAMTLPDNRLQSQVVTELNSIKKAEVIKTADLVALPAPAVEKGRRVALVLGNAAYSNLPLVNTRNDAAVIEAALKQIDFEVVTVIDGDFEAMSAGIRKFLVSAQESAVALVYFAGHGIEVNGRNFLVATDVDMTSPQSVLGRSIDVTDMLATLGTVTRNTKIIILDACRENPFPEKFKRQQQGLAQIEAPIETFIAFSTSPGKVAEDGAGKNSPYTRSLASRLVQPGVNLEAVFREVRKSVVSDTKGRQTPWENTSLTTDVRLASAR